MDDGMDLAQPHRRADIRYSIIWTGGASFGHFVGLGQVSEIGGSDLTTPGTEIFEALKEASDELLLESWLAGRAPILPTLGDALTRSAWIDYLSAIVTASRDRILVGSAISQLMSSPDELAIQRGVDLDLAMNDEASWPELPLRAVESARVLWRLTTHRWSRLPDIPLAIFGQAEHLRRVLDLRSKLQSELMWIEE